MAGSATDSRQTQYQQPVTTTWSKLTKPRRYSELQTHFHGWFDLRDLDKLLFSFGTFTVGSADRWVGRRCTVILVLKTAVEIGSHAHARCRRCKKPSVEDGSGAY